jgi:hypothetical protein
MICLLLKTVQVRNVLAFNIVINALQHNLFPRAVHPCACMKALRHRHEVINQRVTSHASMQRICAMHKIESDSGFFASGEANAVQIFHANAFAPDNAA